MISLVESPQKAGNVEPAEEEDPDPVDADRWVRVVQPLHQPNVPLIGEGVFRARGGIGPGKDASGYQAGFFQAFEDRIKLAGAHFPDPPEMLWGAEPLQ